MNSDFLRLPPSTLVALGGVDPVYGFVLASWNDARRGPVHSVIWSDGTSTISNFGKMLYEQPSDVDIASLSTSSLKVLWDPTGKLTGTYV